MTGFIDIYLPDKIITYPCSMSLRFSSQLTASDSGDEQRNQNWVHPLRRWSIPDAVNTEAQVIALRNHFMVMAGPISTFPFVDPFDFASVPLEHPAIEPTISALDVAVGTGDGFTDSFQLTLPYVSGAETYIRDIHLPVVDSVLIALDGVDPLSLSPPITWMVSRPGGVVLFSTPIANTVEITAGFLFDCEARYEADDSFDQVYRHSHVNGFGALNIFEARPC